MLSFLSLSSETLIAAVMPIVQVSTTPLAAPDHAGFSFVELFLKADIVVKLVMIGLVLASVWSWAVVVDKFISFRLLNKRASDFEETFWSGRTLEELDSGLGKENKDPMGRVFAAAMRELRESKDGAGRLDGDLGGTRERIDRVMTLVVNRELSKAESGLGVLATIGSAAPFIGLFGTVWGIINAFRLIDQSGSADFSVVVGPLAEALFATALGLLAAIPAVIFYNKFSGDLSKYAGRLEGYADELSAILSRKISKGGQG